MFKSKRDECTLCVSHFQQESMQCDIVKSGHQDSQVYERYHFSGPSFKDDDTILNNFINNLATCTWLLVYFACAHLATCSVPLFGL